MAPRRESSNEYRIALLGAVDSLECGDTAPHAAAASGTPLAAAFGWEAFNVEKLRQVAALQRVAS